MSPKGQVPAVEYEEAMQCESVEQQQETVTPPTLPASASAASAPRPHEPSAAQPPPVPSAAAQTTAELLRAKETADLGGHWWTLAGTPSEADVAAMKADALKDLEAGKCVHVVELVPPKDLGELFADFKVKSGQITRRLPARFFTAPKARTKPAVRTASRPTGPTFRTPSEEELLPLEVAAKRELPAAKELLAYLLTGVEKGSELEIAIRQHPYASALAIRRRDDLGKKYWATASAPMLELAAFMFQKTGLPAHLSPPPLAMPKGVAQEAYSRFVCMHYPPPSAAEHGYTKPDGHPPDATTRLLERAVQTALKRLGIEYLWGAQYHGMFDLCGSAHATTVVIEKEDGTSVVVPFDFGRDFWDKLSDLDQFRWHMLMVKVLAAVMVDMITIHGHVGARCLITGSNPQERWPELLEDVRATLLPASHCLPPPVSVSSAICLFLMCIGRACCRVLRLRRWPGRQLPTRTASRCSWGSIRRRSTRRVG